MTPKKKPIKSPSLIYTHSKNESIEVNLNTLKAATMYQIIFYHYLATRYN